MCRARVRVITALIALLVQVILVVAGLSVYLVGDEPSTVKGVPEEPSAQGVPEPS